jgi:hypothetical protein
MSGHTMIGSMISVMNVQLRVCGVSALKRKDRASLMNELATQDIGVRATTTPIDCGIGCFANRSHGQRVVVKKNVLVKARSQRIVASEKTIKGMWNVLKGRERYFALIAAHAKARIDVRGVREGLSFPVKGMTKGTFNGHVSKIVNLTSRVKGPSTNRKVQWRLWKMNSMVK